MLLQLTDLSEESLHSQIVRQLIEKIINGDLSDGTELLSIRALAREYHVSVNTVKRAYEILEKDGLIQSRTGQGFFVASLTPEQRQAIAMQRMLGNKSPLNIIETFSKQLISVFDPEHLRTIAEENLKSHLLVEEIFFIIYDDRTDEYILMITENYPAKFNINSSDKLLQAICQLKVPVNLRTLKLNIKESALASLLIERRVNLIVPLNEADKMLGFLALTGKKTGMNYTFEEMNLLVVLANQFVTALTTARFYVEAIERRRIKEEMNMARQIQASLLPKELPDNEKYTIAAAAISSRAVGGDFYDYFQINDNQHGLVIGDACGKGLPAAMLISQIQAMIHSEVEHGHHISTILELLNRQMVQFIPKDKFVTLLYGIYDQEKDEIELGSAGHNYPIIVRENGQREQFETNGPALGLVPDACYHTSQINLFAGDTLLLFTDGITEAMNEKQEQFGEERLIALVTQNRHLNAHEMLQLILKTVEDFGAGEILQDDRTMMVLKRNFFENKGIN
jgi:sigma-B regulation protein RsbU (phosphoserine phosphatase)